MILLHSTASSSTFGAHPHPPQCLPNLNGTPKELDEQLLYINHFAVYNPDSILYCKRLM